MKPKNQALTVQITTSNYLNTRNNTLKMTKNKLKQIICQISTSPLPTLQGVQGFKISIVINPKNQALTVQIATPLKVLWKFTDITLLWSKNSLFTRKGHHTKFYEGSQTYSWAANRSPLFSHDKYNLQAWHFSIELEEFHEVYKTILQ